MCLDVTSLFPHISPLHAKTPPLPHLSKSPTLTNALEEKLWDALETKRTFDFLVEYTGENESKVAGILNIWEIEAYITVSSGLYTRTSL